MKISRKIVVGAVALSALVVTGFSATQASPWGHTHSHVLPMAELHHGSTKDVEVSLTNDAAGDTFRIVKYVGAEWSDRPLVGTVVGHGGTVKFGEDFHFGENSKVQVQLQAIDSGGRATANDTVDVTMRVEGNGSAYVVDQIDDPNVIAHYDQARQVLDLAAKV